VRIDYEQLEFIHPTLRRMIRDVEDATGFEFTITSLYRIGDKGNHGQLPLRAVDLRCRKLAMGVAIEEYVNHMWVYDPARPHLRCCMIHDTGQGLHFHFQVHPDTMRRE
jgi:hypothetical protein